MMRQNSDDVSSKSLISSWKIIYGMAGVECDIGKSNVARIGEYWLKVK